MANNIINSFNKQWATTANALTIQTTDIEDKVQLNKAIVSLNQAIGLYPEQPVLYFNRGFYHFKSKNYHDACKDAAKAIELSDEFLEARKLKCICMLEINDIRNCSEEIKKAIVIYRKLDDHVATIYFERLLNTLKDS